MSFNDTAKPLEHLRGVERRSIGKYRFIGRIGSGGMAEVFLAVQEGPARFRKLIAVKVLRSQFAEMAEGREMFLNEARLAARLSHPNVVSVLEVGEEDGDLFIAMEYLKGKSFSRLLSRSPRAGAGSVPARVLLRILSEALAGVHHAHEAQEFDGTPLRLVHRDLTPQNIFVTYEGEVKVLDFGIAKAVSNTNETRAGMIKGKIPFMAPEQLCGESAIDRRVDIYSMGCCLWQSLTGLRPFKGMTDMEAVNYIIARGLPPVRESAPDVPAELEQICAKATAFDREDRYPDAAAFQADVDAYLTRTGDVGRRHISTRMSEVFEGEAIRVQQIIESALSCADTSSLPPVSLTGQREIPVVRTTERPPAPESMHAPATLAPPPAARKPGIPWAAVALGVAVTLTAGAFVLRYSARPTAPVQAATTAAAPSAALSARLRISAQPAEAHLFLDGASIASNPIDFNLSADGSRHMLRAEAPGYFDRVLEITLDGDKEVMLALDKVPEKSTKPAAALGPGLPAPGTASNARKGPSIGAKTTYDMPMPAAKKTQRQLDLDNPFERK